MIPTLQRVTTLLFMAKNSQNRAKSNDIFPEKSRQEGPWFCNIWIARRLNSVLKIFVFFDFDLLYRVKWGQSWEKTEKKCKLFVQRAVSVKIWIFQKFLKHCFPLLKYYLWRKFQQDRTIFGAVRAQKNPKRVISWMLHRHENIGKFINWQPQML